MAAELGLGPSDPIKGGRRAEVAEIAATADIVEQMHRYGALAGGGNILEGCDHSFKCVASGITCWATFCDMSGGPHFPRKGEAAPAGSADFPAGGASQRNLPHSEKACHLLRYNLGWETEAVAHVAIGPARAGGRMGAPKRAVPKALSVRMLRSASMADGFTQATWVSRTFFLRGQSERWPLVRQMPPERMGEDSILKAPAAIGTWGH